MDSESTKTFEKVTEGEVCLCFSLCVNCVTNVYIRECTMYVVKKQTQKKAKKNKNKNKNERTISIMQNQLGDAVNNANKIKQNKT